MDDGTYRVDDRRWPLVRVVVPAKNPDTAGHERHLAQLDALLRRREPFVVVVDARFGATLPTEQRERFRRHRRAAFLEAQRYQRAVAFVFSSPFQRAVLTAVTWLAPEPCPLRTFASVEEAEQWALSCLRGSDAA